MVNQGETAQKASYREFIEEALDGKTFLDLEKIWSQKSQTIYKGYVDDPRNTDNAWMETRVINFHDWDNIFNKIELKVNFLKNQFFFYLSIKILTLS